MVLTETVTDRLATRNVQDVTREFADLVEDGELLGLGFVAVATASGVAVAQQVVDMVVPRLPDDLNLSKDPRQARDFLAAGLLEGLWAFTVGLVAVKFIGTGRPFLFATAVGLSIGGFAIAGANLIEWGQRAFATVTSMSAVEGSLGEFSGGESRSQVSASDDARAGGQEPVATDGGFELAAVENPQHEARAGAMRTRPVAA